LKKLVEVVSIPASSEHNEDILELVTLNIMLRRERGVAVEVSNKRNDLGVRHRSEVSYGRYGQRRLFGFGIIPIGENARKCREIDEEALSKAVDESGMVRVVPKFGRSRW
jgi:hypothetical protein